MKTILRLLADIGRWANNKLVATEEREAVAASLQKGVIVKISNCPCPYAVDHDGLWVIDRYNPDPDDYRIVRMSDGKSDYAKREVMEVVGSD